MRLKEYCKKQLKLNISKMKIQGKKKSMMKCLSENYLLKANYKKLLTSK